MKLHQYVQQEYVSFGPAPVAIDKHRVCSKCGKTLSRYNKGPLCYSCQEKQAKQKLLKADSVIISSSNHPIQKCRICGNIRSIAAKGLCVTCLDMVRHPVHVSAEDRAKIQILISEGKTNRAISKRGFTLMQVKQVRYEEGRAHDHLSD